MATVTNPDGTVTEFKIGQETELQATGTDASPKKRGKKARQTKEGETKRMLGAQIKVEWYNAVVSEFGNPTAAINALIEKHLASKKSS